MVLYVVGIQECIVSKRQTVVYLFLGMVLLVGLGLDLELAE